MALYPELFRSLERARWSLADDVPWDRFDPRRSPTSRRSPSR